MLSSRTRRLLLRKFQRQWEKKSSIFLHTYNPDPALLSLGPLDISWYGFFYVVGIVGALFFVRPIARKRGIGDDALLDLAVWLLLGGFLGARLWYVFFVAPGFYFADPFAVFQIWEGGLSIFGGIAGGACALFLALRYTRKRGKRLSFLSVSDVLVPGLSLAQAFGRWGNYFNEELFGKPTDLPWGIPIEPQFRPPGFAASPFFHPTFLYESLLNLALAIGLVVFARVRPEARHGSLTAAYLLGYALIRFSLEFLRVDPTPAFAGLRMHQWVSIIIVIGVLTLLMKRRYVRMV